MAMPIAWQFAPKSKLLS